MKESGIAVIKANELTKVEHPHLNDEQLKLMLKKTPPQYVQERPAKGGGKWKYVTGGYVKKLLNLMFGWDWDFEIVSEIINLEAKQVIVKGRLTCRTPHGAIVKMQYGRQDIKFRKNTQEPLDLGNDLKGAATDALKKCASELGIASDIYNANEFREVEIETRSDDELLNELRELFEKKEEHLRPEDQESIERIIINREAKSYRKAITLLEKA